MCGSAARCGPRRSAASQARTARSWPPTWHRFIGAALLWYFTVGSVRGFAFFLGLSTILDMIVSFFFTRPAVILMSRSKAFAGADVLGVHRGEAMTSEDQSLVGASR